MSRSGEPDPRLGLRMSPVQILLLVRLDAAPAYGYELLKAIRDAFEGVWEPKTGTIYPALRSLERQGLVTTRERKGVDFYHMTEKGRRFLSRLGQHQEANMAFTTRFIATVLNWMSPELKKELASSFLAMSSEGPITMGGAAFANLLDQGFDKQTRLSLLKAMKGNVSARLEKMTEIINKMEAQDA